MSSIKFLLFYTILLFGILQLTAQEETSDYVFKSLITNNIDAPGRMAIDSDDNIYIVDAIQKSIVKYDGHGNYLTTITTDFNPTSIAINDNDLLFIADKGTGNIYIVSENGDKTLFYSGINKPNSMVFGLKILYVTDSEQKKVLGIDISGNVVTHFTYEKFVYLTGIAFDPSNNYLLVAEHGGIGEDMEKSGGCSMCWSSYGPQTAVYAFDLEGNHIRTFGFFGNEDGEFQRIQGIAVGTCGNYYTVDPYLGRVSVFDNSGNFITKFGLHGNNDGEFNLPMDIVFTSDNRAFVSSMNKGAIDVFSIDNILPSATITSANQTVCSVENAIVDVLLTGIGPWSFTYTVDGLNPTTINTVDITTDPEIKNFNIPVIEVGLYEVTAVTDSTDTSGTCLTGTTYIQESIPPTVAILTTELTKCDTEDSGIEVQFTGLAPFTFTYTIDGLNPTEIITTNNLYILNPEQSGFYEITNLSDDGCSGTEILGNSLVTVNPLPTASILSEINEFFVNPGQIADVSIAFTGTAPFTFTYLKDGAEMTPITTSDSPYNFNVSEEGTYEIMSISDGYCSNNEQQGSFDLVFNNILPTATIITETLEFCSGGSGAISIDFTGSSPWIFSYTIDGLNPVEITTSDNSYLLSASLPGGYQLSAVSDINGEGIFSGYASVSIFEQPIVDLGPDIHLCEGDSVYILDPEGDYASYLWSNGSTNSTLAVSSPGTYSVTVNNAEGCTASDEVIVSIGQLPDSEFFYDVNRLETQFISESTNSDHTHNWEFGDGNSSFEENPVQTYSKKGTYTVTHTVTSDYCGTIQTSKTIYVGSSEVADVVVIYPNPSYGEFTLKINPVNPITTIINILIKNTSGQIIYTGSIDPNRATHYDGSIYKNISLYNFSKGIYILYVDAGNFNAEEKLVLKD